MSNNIIETLDNDLGGAFRLKIERDTYGDFIATQEAGPPALDGANMEPGQVGGQSHAILNPRLYTVLSRPPL